MRILITGANGMLGRELAPVLAPRHEVRAVSHAECDIADESSIGHAVAEWTPELVINCAALSDVDGCERDPERALAVNGHGAGHLARAAEHGLRFRRRKAHALYRAGYAQPSEPIWTQQTGGRATGARRRSPTFPPLGDPYFVALWALPH